MCLLPLSFRNSLLFRAGQLAYGVFGSFRRFQRTASVILSLAGVFACTIPETASAVTIGLTRFGTCFPAADCAITINDNDVLDLDPTLGVIQFSTSVGQLPDGTFLASGTATEVVTPEGGILLTLTDTTVQGTGGGIGAQPTIAGQIAVTSMAVLSSPGGAAGFASLVGEYQSFPNTAGGLIGFSDVLLQARVGGGLLGLADPAAAAGAISPLPFFAFDARVFPFPVSNVLIGTLDFQVGAGNGFFLPLSAESFATPVPEPSTTVSLVSGLIGLLALRTRARR